MGKNGTKRGTGERPESVSRRAFLSKGAAGVGAAALVGASANKAKAQVKWDLSADVVIIGAGVSGLAAAITARDNGASVISVDENFDIGGRGMLSGGRVHLGGGHALQQKAGIKDSAGPGLQGLGAARRDRRALQRPRSGGGCLPTRISRPSIFWSRTASSSSRSGRPRGCVHRAADIRHRGSGRSRTKSTRRAAAATLRLVRRLEQSARKKGVQILLRHEMKSIIREHAGSGKCKASRVAIRRHHEHRGRGRAHHRPRRPHRQRHFRRRSIRA